MRRLPHIYSADQLFLTWHLAGSLPENRYPPLDITRAGTAFVWMDRYLDTTRTGPHYLRDPRVAAALADELTTSPHWCLQSWVIMSNHIHVLCAPISPVSKMMQSIKGRTAHIANRLLQRKGQFWQHESYDRAVRSPEESQRMQSYIERNPVQAGLVDQPDQYPWSSANPNWLQPPRL